MAILRESQASDRKTARLERMAGKSIAPAGSNAPVGASRPGSQPAARRPIPQFQSLCTIPPLAMVRRRSATPAAVMRPR